MFKFAYEIWSYENEIACQYNSRNIGTVCLLLLQQQQNDNKINAKKQLENIYFRKQKTLTNYRSYQRLLEKKQFLEKCLVLAEKRTLNIIR